VKITLKIVAMLAALFAPQAKSSNDVDLRRYFPTGSAERSQREQLLAEVDAFTTVSPSSLSTAGALLEWLTKRESLAKSLHRHDIYVYLRAEEDTDDHADASADAAISDALGRIDAATEREFERLGSAALNNLMAQNTGLAAYRYFIESTLRQAEHASQNENPVRLLADPALSSLADSYRSLLRFVQPSPSSPVSNATARDEFEAGWEPYQKNEIAFSGLLIPIVQLQDGKARLRGFAGAPEAAYFAAGLTAAEVNGVLAALQRSTAYKRYEVVITSAAAQQLHESTVKLHAWDVDAADIYQPTRSDFSDAVSLILAAEQPMGAEYAGQFARLFEPANHRVELCEGDRCDNTGFSFGYASATSGLFYGSYRGTTDSIRALAHEAGHAVHRELMNENQPLAAYNSGPHFMFESFAIFNELLLLDRLYDTAPTPAAKAYYLHKFLDDATFQIYGSAREADLEQQIYSGVRNGGVHGAKDLDTLTLKVFSQYLGAPELAPELSLYWARNRLYFTDPLYDVNYLFAGLLALEYFRQFEADPQNFSRRYVSLLKNGFTDTPQRLAAKFLGIDLDNSERMVSNATTLIEERTATLEMSYRVP
jgi:oligoendopeptidase F